MIFENFDDFLVDPTLIEGGVDFDLGKDRTIKMKSAGTANKQFSNYLATELKKNQDVLEGLSAAEKDQLARESISRALSKYVIVDIKGISAKDDNGKKITDIEELAFQLLINSDEFYEFAYRQSNNLDNYRKQQVKESGNV